MIKVFKAVFTTLCLLVAVNVFAADKVTVYVKPQPIVAGDPAQLVIAVDSDYYPRLKEYPVVKNLQWQESGASYLRRSVNGIVTSEAGYWFVVNEAGTYEIPAMQINVGGKTVTTDKIVFKAVSGGNIQTSTDGGGDSSQGGVKQQLKDLVFSKAIILAEGRDFYVGEEIPIEVRLYFLRGLNAGPTTWPQFNVDNVIFRDYSKTNQRNNQFDQPTQSTEQINGQVFNVIKFRTAFRPIATGKLDLKAKVDCEIRVPQQREKRSRSWFDDDFFDGFGGMSNYRRINYAANADFPELTIKALPPAPEGADFIGLVGNWHVEFSIVGDEIKVGDPFTLKMEIKGMGTMDTLDAPKLKIPGFRVYKPEIEKGVSSAVGSQKASVKYVMIPMNKGNADLKMSVSTFSCAREKYQVFNFNRMVKVAESDNPTVNNGSVFVDSSADHGTSDVEAEPDKNKPRSGILYLKRNLAGTVTLPLYLNYLWFYILAGIGAPLIWLLSELRYKWKLKVGSDPLLRRKLNARSNRGKVLKALKHASDDKLDEAIQKEAVPYINDMLSLPPGTTASDLAGRVKDQELAECLSSAGHSSYMPGGGSMDKHELRTKMLKALKRLSIIALMLVLPLNGFSADSKEAAKPANPVVKSEKITDAVQALTAYDKGEFRKAAEYYYDRIEHYQPDPALLYNLGNCFCQAGDYPRALVCFERAHLLAPYDSEITENLNYVKRKLFQPETGKIRNPLDLVMNLRNQLRPDQWLAIAAGLWLLLGIGLALRQRYSKNKLIVLLVVVGFALSVALAAVVSQYLGDYRGNNAVVIGGMVKVYSLPSDSTAREIARVSGGTLVKISEKRIDWVRIRYDNTEGWVRCEDISSTSPGGKLPSLPWQKKAQP